MHIPRVFAVQIFQLEIKYRNNPKIENGHVLTNNLVVPIILIIN